ncbi:MAG: ATP-binding cassette domain-containing protein, partial [Chloroflexota bacterium]|nr:ATP-binding cassette domain-containing protein [Chloroflexota bacterium]
MTTSAGAPPVAVPPPAGGYALRTRGLFKRYGSRPALQGLDLAVPRGVIYGFLGPNGAGKTTLMRLLVGLMRPDAGEIEILGQPYTWRERERLHDIGALVESPTFYDYLSGRDNLRALAASGARVPDARVDEVLSLVGLAERGRDKARRYSLGMKQRLGIAAALLSDPQLLLLDEPANGLDPGGIVAMRQTLRALTAQGKTVFISSHILPEVQQLVDVVGIVDAGRLIREGSLADLLSEGGHVRARVTAAELPTALAALAVLGVPTNARPAETPGSNWIDVRITPERAPEVNRILAGAGIYAGAITSGSD